MRNNTLITIAFALAAAAPAAVSAQVGFAAGAKVVDTTGGEVGTVTGVQGDNIVVKTDKHEVALPKASFAASDKGLLFALTQAQLNAEVEKTLAAQGPLLSSGATVYDPQGGVVGTVESFDAEFATLKLPNAVVKLPVSAFARGSNGPVIGETAASLEAKVSAASAPAK